MHNEESADFIEAANDDLQILEESRYFGFKSANMACFHAQQYAEKMIKARLIELGLELERTHNLLYLLDDFPDTPEIRRARDYCYVLTGYEARTRYPMYGFTRFTPEDAEEAYGMAIQIPYLIGLFKESDDDVIDKSMKPGL